MPQSVDTRQLALHCPTIPQIVGIRVCEINRIRITREVYGFGRGFGLNGVKSNYADEMERDRNLKGLCSIRSL